ncbi:hypothetical protein ACFW7J_21780 [Streptomyces sp. NPDC059525]|uniref:hypothetical protein n=1 Tax=Streptomyces sp. NPDC059525 TaxID=3346857 RepID=UPI00367C0791
MTHRPYEHDLGTLYLTYAPAHVDDDDAALALIANFPDISAARIEHGLACRHFVTTGDETRIDAYFVVPWRGIEWSTPGAPVLGHLRGSAS